MRPRHSPRLISNETPSTAQNSSRRSVPRPSAAEEIGRRVRDGVPQRSLQIAAELLRYAFDANQHVAAHAGRSIAKPCDEMRQRQTIGDPAEQQEGDGDAADDDEAAHVLGPSPSSASRASS